jgi:3-dehydrosphinganine reductase
MRKSLAGKRAFVTGGTSGIGLATAEELLKRGVSVAICGRDRQRLELALAKLRRAVSSGARLHGLSLDVADAAAVAAQTPEVIAALGGLDILINNAGATLPAEAHHTSLADYRTLMEVNYFGTVNVTKACLGHFLAQRGGTLAGVLSVAGFMGVYGYSAYAASKHALLGFFDSLRQELKPANVSVSLLMPGDTDTPMLAYEEPLKPAATRAVAGNVPVLEASSVARCFVAGIASGAYHVVPGRHAKLAYYAQRFAPALVRQIVDLDVRRALARG